MATRLYFPSASGSAISPAYEAGWVYTDEAERATLLAARLGDDVDVPTLGVRVGSWTADADHGGLVRQYVSDAMPAGIVFDLTTVKCYIHSRQYNNGDEVRTRLSIRVVEADGTTFHTLLALGHAGTGAEIANTTGRNIAYAVSGTGIANYTTQAGDRLVVEIGGGYNGVNGQATPEMSCKWGASIDTSGSGADATESEAQTQNAPGWIEFSADFSFVTPVSASHVGAHEARAPVAATIAGGHESIHPVSASVTGGHEGTYVGFFRHRAYAQISAVNDSVAEKSALCFDPDEDCFYTVTNNARTIRRLDRTGTQIGSDITFPVGNDLEGIEYLGARGAAYGGRFVIMEEGEGTDPYDQVRFYFFDMNRTTTSISSGSVTTVECPDIEVFTGEGCEGVAYDPSRDKFYIPVQDMAASGGGLWEVTITGGTASATRLFRWNDTIVAAGYLSASGSVSDIAIHPTLKGYEDSLFVLAWVGDAQTGQGYVFEMDRSGNILSVLDIGGKGQIEGIAWDEFSDDILLAGEETATDWWRYSTRPQPSSSTVIDLEATGWRYSYADVDYFTSSPTFYDPSFDPDSPPAGSAWSTGQALIGYGTLDYSGGTRTLRTNIGKESPSEVRALYYRRTFTIDDADAITAAAVQIYADDAAVVWINGTEVATRWSPPSPRSHSGPSTNTAAGGDEGNLSSPVSIDPGLFVDGTNVIAVSVHNVNSSSSDLGADLVLTVTEGLVVEPIGRRLTGGLEGYEEEESTPVSNSVVGGHEGLGHAAASPVGAHETTSPVATSPAGGLEATSPVAVAHAGAHEGVQPAAGAHVGAHEALGLPSASLAGGLESVAPVAASAVGGLEGLGSPASTAQGGHETTSPVASGLAGAMEALAPVGGELGGGIEALAPVLAARTGGHESYDADSVSASHTGSHEATAPVVAVLGGSLEGTEPIAGGATGGLEAVQSIASTFAGGHEALGLAAPAIAGGHEAAAPLAASLVGVHEALAPAAASMVGGHGAVAPSAAAPQGAHECTSVASTARAGGHEALVPLAVQLAGGHAAVAYVAVSGQGAHECYSVVVATISGGQEGILPLGAVAAGAHEGMAHVEASFVGWHEAKVVHVPFFPGAQSWGTSPFASSWSERSDVGSWRAPRAVSKSWTVREAP